MPSSSSDESVFAITRNFLKYQVPARLQSFSPTERIIIVIIIIIIIIQALR
jgi:hypothetical protein